uniref:Uncharacterized protein n=1 Tax=viral metagenome TaxID=1070528 RepID=A0A6M3LML8_9ZZZZ
MSHISRIEREKAYEMADLERMCKMSGGLYQFVRNQTNYKWFGTWVGNTPMPEGMTKEKLGKCDHVIKVRGAEYEIGVIEKKKQKAELVWDYWKNGGLPNVIGENGWKFNQDYDVFRVKQECIKRRLRWQEKRLEEGRVEITVHYN